MELLYRSSRDGKAINTFHRKCDYQGPTIVLYKNDRGNIFGDYSSISWKRNKDECKIVKGCFLFTSSNIYNIPPTKFSNK